MIEHDDMCPNKMSLIEEGFTCNYCVLINMVRINEQERIATNAASEWAEAVLEYQANLHAKVDVLTRLPFGGWDMVFLKDVQALLNGDSNDGD